MRLSRKYASAWGRVGLLVALAGRSGLAGPSLRLTFKPPARPAERREVRWIQARALEAAPFLDGQLRDRAWSSASSSTSFVNVTDGKAPDRPLRMLVGHAEGKLYLGIHVEGQPEQDERLELLFDALHGHESCQVLVALPTGKVEGWSSAGGKQEPWEPGVESRVEGDAHGWNLELALPRKSLADPTNGIVGFNVVHAGRTLATWNPAGSDARRPEGLGHLAFETLTLTVQAVRAGTFVHGGNLFHVQVGNRSAKQVKARAVLAVDPEDGSAYRRYYQFVVQGDEVGLVPLRYVLPEKGKADVGLVLLDDELKQRYFAFTRRNITPVDAIRVQEGAAIPWTYAANIKLAFRREELDSLQFIASLRQAMGARTLAVCRQRKLPSGEFDLRVEDDLAPATYELRLSVLREGLVVASRKIEFTVRPEE